MIVSSAFPAAFSAMHLYVPLSISFIFLNTNSPLSVTFALSGKSLPTLIHEIVGDGIPLAVQMISASVSTSMKISLCFTIIDGKAEIIHCFGLIWSWFNT